MKSYPFETKREILARLEGSDSFVLESLMVLYAFQTAHEQERRTTDETNRRGFASCHAATGCKLSEKVLTGEELTPSEQDAAAEITSHYGKQLAAYSRANAISNSPELAEASACYFSPQ